jgi:hypothetical protein
LIFFSTKYAIRIIFDEFISIANKSDAMRIQNESCRSLKGISHPANQFKAIAAEPAMPIAQFLRGGRHHAAIEVNLIKAIEMS